MRQVQHEAERSAGQRMLAAKRISGKRRGRMRIFGIFWYSEKQYDWTHRITGGSKLYARIVFGPRVGRVVIYTEMLSIRSLRDLFRARPFGSWDDYRWLGLGWFHRIEGN